MAPLDERLGLGRAAVRAPAPFPTAHLRRPAPAPVAGAALVLPQAGLEQPLAVGSGIPHLIRHERVHLAHAQPDLPVLAHLVVEAYSPEEHVPAYEPRDEGPAYLAVPAHPPDVPTPRHRLQACTLRAELWRKP